MFSLKGKTAIVTGASRGIGWAIAEGLSKAGADVIGIARSEKPDRELTGRYLSMDVRSFVNPLDQVDILVNCAGISRPNGGLEDFDETLATNLRAPHQTIMAVLPAMKNQGGSIINVTSLNAYRGFPNNPAYVASKGGLSQLTRAFANDLAPFGIRVNNLVPGYIETTSSRWAKNPVEKARRAKHTMLGHVGIPDDMIGPAVFLASDASAYITGQDIIVDGGWLAKGLI